MGLFKHLKWTCSELDLPNESSAVSGPQLPDRLSRAELSTFEPSCLSLPRFLSTTSEPGVLQRAAAADAQGNIDKIN